MNTLTIILLIYVILDIISTIIALLLMRRKGIGFRDLANRLRWLCKKEEPITEDEDIDDQGYGY